MKRRWPSTAVIAVDEMTVLERALRMRAADVVGEKLELAADASLVVLAAPVRANIEVLGNFLGFYPATPWSRMSAARRRQRSPRRRHFRGGCDSSAAIRWRARRWGASTKRSRSCSTAGRGC